jgi:tetratricopeptide (TPR) repeat protein
MKKTTVKTRRREEKNGSRGHRPCWNSFFAFLRFFVPSWFILFDPSIALAQGARKPAPLSEAQRYEACMTMTRRDPATAFDQALTWQDQNGGSPARHCAAVALIGLKQYKPAAERLEKLAQEMKNPEDEAVRVGILAQAGQAWLLAGDTSRAHAVQSAALKLAPQDPELWIDRGQTLATAKNYRDAALDFDQAIKIDAGRADAFLFRASARRFLEDLAGARRDIDAALRLKPTDPDALVERGSIRRLSNDDAGAREDWMTVIKTHPDSPAAATANANLEKMDVKQ